jgi:Flp pilus assembly protein TadG
MKLKRNSILNKFIRQTDGQTLAFTAVILTSFLGLSGIALDAGHGYYAYQRLSAATNSAALAGAAGMPNTTTAAANVTAYSSATGSSNFLGSIMTNVVATPTFSCSTTVTTKLSVPCETASGASGGYNSITVKQTATVPTWFGQFFGMKQFNISASAMAAMAGGANTPYNVAIVLDTTKSMADPDSGQQCTGTQISCALSGVQALLQLMYPCGSNQTSCTSSSTPVDQVSLFVFPPILTSSATNDYVCKTSNPTHEYYEVPTLPATWTYQLPFGTTKTADPWSTDYLTSDTATSLNGSSELVTAVGGGSCSGVQAPGGAGTYYAQVIYLAQAQLAAQATANPGSKNAMIILTDGNATACATGANTTSGACSTSADMLPTTGTLNGTGTKTSNASGYNIATYPSALGECGQAVAAAKAAATAGTVVFTFGYGSPNSGSSANCGSDQKISTAVTTGGGSWAAGGSPCQALAAMASDPANFYSDDADGCKATNTYNQGITKLTTMFQSAWKSLTQPRLVPVGSA